MEKRFLKEGDSTSVKKNDVGVENKWSWKWQDEIVTRQLIEGTVSYKMRDCIFKYDVAGEAWCNYCWVAGQVIENLSKELETLLPSVSLLWEFLLSPFSFCLIFF